MYCIYYIKQLFFKLDTILKEIEHVKKRFWATNRRGKFSRRGGGILQRLLATRII